MNSDNKNKLRSGLSGAGVPSSISNQQVIPNIIEQGIDTKPIAKSKIASAKPAIEKLKPELLDFNGVLSTLSNELSDASLKSLFDDNKEIKLRSMTVSEFKSMSKALEQFESDIRLLDRSQKDYKMNSKRIEQMLLGELDVILSRCITNGVATRELIIYDWVYSLLYLRCISRGTESTFSIKCSNKTCDAYIKSDISKVVSDLENNKSEFNNVPSESIVINDNLSLLIMPPIRNDFIYVGDRLSTDQLCNQVIVDMSMWLKGYISGDQVFIFSNEQRETVFDSLTDTTFDKIKTVIDDIQYKFYRNFSVSKCPKCEKETTIDMSDFIMFFFVI